MRGKLPILDIAQDSTWVKNLDSLADLKGGVFKDFVRRVLIARDEPWWNKQVSEWKITAFHDWTPPDTYTPDYWEERVLDLCSYDITRNNFGFGYNELMELDPATFEKIEKKVHDMAARQQAALHKEGIGLNNKGI